MRELISSKEFVYQSPIFTMQTDRLYKLVEPFVFEWLENGEVHQILIPAGDISDGASNPRLFWTLSGILPSGLYLGAAFVHDELYKNKGKVTISKVASDHSLTPEPVQWSREQCDSLFLLIMQSAKVDPKTAYVMWKAVRLFGWAWWDKSISVFNIFGIKRSLLHTAHGG